MSYHSPDLLLLDEPTNHLDIDSRISLINSLNAFEGAIILVSHDNDIIEKVTDQLTIFSSILTPQGKYLFDFFILKLKDSYLLECEKKSTGKIIKLLNYYKLRTKVDFIDLAEKYVALVNPKLL